MIPTHIRSSILVAFVPFLLAAASVPEQARTGRAVTFDAQDWWTYENSSEAFSLRLPRRLKIHLVKTDSLQWSADNRMPFDYVNFRPQPPDPAAAPFELGVGVHWNRDRLATRAFADRKDEGLLSGGAQIRTVRQSTVTVCGIRGVRDDFRLRQPSGWQSYSRVIIPYKDRFFVFLGTLGADTPVPGYERVYQKILDTFQIRDVSEQPS